jgi:hypothetical protein
VPVLRRRLLSSPIRWSLAAGVDNAEGFVVATWLRVRGSRRGWRRGGESDRGGGAEPTSAIIRPT